uniref:QNE_V4 n=1 Tax=Pseudoperonospora cubensis TaxID=143453 RepID=E9LK35_PSECC|nr:QNE_V4 [Pseudoperonospora cubensis]
MMPPAKLVAYIAVASSIVLARYEASTDITSTSDANKLSISAPSDPVQHDTKQLLRTSDTAVTKDNEERMFNAAGLKRASTMSHFADVHGLPHEPLAPHLHDTYDPAGASHPPVLPYTGEAKAHEDLQHAASTSNPLKKISPADTQLTEGENNEAEILKRIMTLMQPVAPRALKRKRKLPDGTETQLQWNESDILDIYEKHKDKFLNIMNEWWLNGLGPQAFERMILENQLPTSIYEDYVMFHAAKDEEMYEHFAKWQNEGILPKEIEEKINAVLPKARKAPLVVRLENKYEVFYKKKQPFEAYRTKLLDEDTEPEEAERLKSKKWDRLRVVLKVRSSQRKTKFTLQWFRKHPNEFLLKSIQEGTPPEDIRSVLGLARLEGLKLFKHPNYEYYLKYLKLWFQTHSTEHWQERVPKGMPPEDVRFILGLGQLKGSEFSQHPNFPEYIKFFELWHEAYTRKKMKEWMQLNTPLDEAFAKLAIRDHNDVEFIVDKSDLYMKQYENEWKKKHPTLRTPAVST